MAGGTEGESEGGTRGRERIMYGKGRRKGGEGGREWRRRSRGRRRSTKQEEEEKEEQEEKVLEGNAEDYE